MAIDPPYRTDIAQNIGNISFGEGCFIYFSVGFFGAPGNGSFFFTVPKGFTIEFADPTNGNFIVKCPPGGGVCEWTFAEAPQPPFSPYGFAVNFTVIPLTLGNGDLVTVDYINSFIYGGAPGTYPILFFIIMNFVAAGTWQFKLQNKKWLLGGGPQSKGQTDNLKELFPSGEVLTLASSGTGTPTTQPGTYEVVNWAESSKGPLYQENTLAWNAIPSGTPPPLLGSGDYAIASPTNP